MRRFVSLFASAVLVAALVTVLPGIVPAEAAANALALSKAGPGTVLVGSSGQFTLTASNPGSSPQYNISFRDVLPLGVTYTGPTSPTDLGAPTIIGDGTTTPQTLIWSDAFDLQPNATNTLTFGVTPSTTRFPVGTGFDNTASVYGSSDPRSVPRFNGTGAPIADANVTTATSNTVSTDVTALKITKDEASPENELLRGVHDDSTVYTLVVTNNPAHPTDSVTVTDYLPADQEFLGCGGVDHSSAPEYSGAPSLTAVPVLTTNCPQPMSVDTVTDPPGHTGVFTEVVWNLSDMAAGDTETITYRAGIPLRANVPFPAGTATTGVQTANLDNNTGAPTRQEGDGAASTNFVEADGTYTGIVAGGNKAVTATAQKTVTVHDVRIHKSVSPTVFTSGDVATYELTIDTGEYEDASDIAVTDVLPNGVCPLDDVANYAPATPANGDCAPDAAFQPTVAYADVTANSDGTFTVHFASVPALAHHGSTTITYSGRMRTAYTGGALQGEPTSAGDSFTNRAEQTAQTEPRPENAVDSGPVSVSDPTSATQTTGGPTLTKQIGERQTPMSCADATYVGLESPVPPELTFTQGDRICFVVTIHFSPDADSRSPTLTDFLPANLAYEAHSFTAGPANTLDSAQFGFDESRAESAGELVWTLGARTPAGDLEVPNGSVFQAVFSALVTGSAPGPAPDKEGNLAKFREGDGAGQAESLGDGVDFAIAPAPIGITKGVAQVGSTVYSPARDGVQVHEGEAVQFHVGVSNASDPATSPPGEAIDNVQVWDVLPVGTTCAAVTTPIADGGTCTDPGDAGHPAFAGSGTRSSIVWTGGVTIAAGDTHTYAYTVTVPAGTSVEDDLVDVAHVRSYDVATDTGTGTAATHYPADNIDPNLPVGATLDPQPASDPSDVRLPSVVVTKGAASGVQETNNSGAESAPGNPTTQAVPGESVTFWLSARIPAHATVYGATLTDDALPAGFAVDSTAAEFAPDAGTAVWTTTLPTGVSFDGAVTISFGSGTPPAYDNETDADQLFRLTIVGHLDAGDTTHVSAGKALSNTGRFSSQAGPDGGPTPADHAASAAANVVEPAPSLTKSNDHQPSQTVTAGTVVTYTLTAGNATGRPPLHNAWVVDCLPAALTFTAFDPSATGASTQPGGNGATSSATACATGLTEIDWNVGDLAPAASKTLTYTATVNPGAAGNMTYTNTANLTGNSLTGTRSTPTDPGAALGRTYTKSASSGVKVAPAGLTKAVTPNAATIGDTVTYTITVTLPANVTFYDLSVIDTPPAAVTPIGGTDPAVTCTNADSTPCSIAIENALDPAGGKIGWLLGDAAESTQTRTVVLTYHATVADVPAATAGATPTNSATVKWDTTSQPAPASAGATFDQTTSVATARLTILEPSLTINKAVSDRTPQPGSTFTYTVTVTNGTGSSVSSAYNATITDAVPVGVVVDPDSISNGGTLSGDGRTISWTVPGPIAKADHRDLTYSATLAATETLTTAGLRNTVTLTGYDGLSSGGRHYAPNLTAQATVTPLFPALTATKAATDGPVTYLGTSYRWTVTVKNANGAGTALAVGAADTLPPNWTYDASSATVAVNGGAAVPTVPTIDTTAGVQTLTFAGLGTLAGGQQLVISYTATPGPDVVTTPGVGHAVNQTNTARPTGTDPTGATGSASGSFSGPAATAVTHIDSADVHLTKAVGTAPVAGGDGTWTITVSNSGPDTAVGPFTVTDGFDAPLPAGVTLDSASGTGWVCTTGPIACSRGDSLASGSAFPVITVQYHVGSGVDSGTAYSNTASVTERTHDPDPTNNSAGASTSVTTVADLGLTKTLDDPDVVAGNEATYSVSVTNFGPSDSRGPITATDTLPAGSTFVSAAGAGWTCPDSASAGAITCTHAATLTAGTNAGVIVVKVDIPSGQTADVVNEATVTPTTPEGPDTHADTDSVTTPTSASADLEISKTLAASPPIVAGGTAHYTIKVTNHGASDAHNVVVEDTLPALLDYDSVSGASDWTCTNSGKQVTCDYTAQDALVAGDTSSFTLVVSVGQQFQGSVTNAATVTSDTPDPDTTNNRSSIDSGVTDEADLSIAKSHTGRAVAGRNVTFTLQVHNHGASDEHGDVTVTDPLPTGTTFVSASGSGWSCDNQSRTVTCTGATDVAAGDDAPPITVVLGIDSDAGPTTMVNTAHVAGSADSPDPNPANNASSDPVDVDVVTDIAIAKTLETAAPVTAGDSASFTLHVSNAGPSDASDAHVVDPLPAHLTLDRPPAEPGWDCSKSTATEVDCMGTVAAGDSSTLTVRTDIDPATPDGTTVDNVAKVSDGVQPGPISSDAVPVPIQRLSDLVLTKSATKTTTPAGTGVTWQIQVTNVGLSDDDGPFTVTDTLPGFETFVSADGGDWSCTADAPPVPPSGTSHQTVTCTSNVPLPHNKDAALLTIVAHIDAAAPGGTQTNSATATSSTTDPNPDNNTDTAGIAVTRSARLSIEKKHTGHGTIGSQVEFELAVHNAGPSVADQVVVTDPLPVGLGFASASGTDWTCGEASGTVTCTLAGSLDPNSDAPVITLATAVHASAFPTVTNTATVHSNDPDLPETDSDDDPLTVDPDAQLAVTKRHQGTFVVGADGRYTIVVENTGPTPSGGPITLTDHLPAGLAFASASGTGWTCGHSGATVTCTRAGALAVRASATIALRVHVSPAAYPQVQNTATASEPGSSPASATDTAPVQSLAHLRLTKTLAGYSGGVATWSIKLTNDGPNPTGAPAEIIDELPAGLQFRSASGAGWTCTDAGQQVTCRHARPMDVHASGTVTVRTAVTAAPGTRVVNTARAGSDPAEAGVSSAELNVPSADPAATGVATRNLIGVALLLLLIGGALLGAGRRRTG